MRGATVRLESSEITIDVKGCAGVLRECIGLTEWYYFGQVVSHREGRPGEESRCWPLRSDVVRGPTAVASRRTRASTSPRRPVRARVKNLPVRPRDTTIDVLRRRIVFASKFSDGSVQVSTNRTFELDRQWLRVLSCYFI